MQTAVDCISDFIFVHTELRAADVILVPGGSYRELMEEAARLYHARMAPLILPSGGLNSRLPREMTEGSFLKEVGVSLGVPERAIIVEEQAQHTFDNARLSKDLLLEKGITIERAILVCKGFHSRRALLTYQYTFPGEVEFMVSPVRSGHCITRENWHLDLRSTQIVMGELQKIGQYFSDKVDVLAQLPGAGIRSKSPVRK